MLTQSVPTVRHQRRMAIALLVLLLIAASRVLLLDDYELNYDEVWSVWQTFGSPIEIVQRTPFDWPPLYYLTLGGWRALVGFHPVTLRLFSTLLFLFGTAFAYQAGKRLSQASPQQREASGWLTAIAYGSLGFITFLSIHVRGYAITLALLPLAVWLLLRYFDEPRWWRGVQLGICMAAMFYTTLTVVPAFAMLGLLSLLIYRWHIWRWWLPGVVAVVITLPEIIDKASLTVRRTAATQTLELPPLPAALLELFSNYTGIAFLLWVLLFGIACGALVYYKRFDARALALGIWVMGMPVALYAANSILGFFSAQYAWWITFGIALWVGMGIALLPRSIVGLAGLLLLGLMFLPLPIERYDIVTPPLASNMQWLTEHIRPGDVLIIDPRSECGPPEEWDYYTRVFFPHGGLQIVNAPEDHRRVWFVVFNGWQDVTLETEIKAGRVTGRFVGPPQCLFQLYEAPPDREGHLFENGMRFHGMDILEGDQPWFGAIAKREGETIRVRLWWSVDQPIAQNFSIGVHLYRAENIVTQSDGAPQVVYPSGSSGETSTWLPEQYYVEERSITVPYPTIVGNYPLRLVVYDWQTNQRYSAPGVDAENRLLLKAIYVKAW